MTRGDDPLGKRALFSPAPGATGPAGPGAGGSGRRAMFSAPGAPVPPAGAPEPAAGGDEASGHLRLECRSCRVVTSLGVTSLVRVLLPSLWVPLLPWSRFLRCPACGRWTPARLSWSPRPAGTPGP